MLRKLYSRILQFYINEDVIFRKIVIFIDFLANFDTAMFAVVVNHDIAIIVEQWLLIVSFHYYESDFDII